VFLGTREAFQATFKSYDAVVMQYAPCGPPSPQ
jgi:hypothetical protein